MTYPFPGAPPDDADTPEVDRGRRWWPYVVLAVAVVVCVAFAMIVRRLLRGPRRQELIMYPSGQPCSGTQYVVEFYDGNFRQLTDLNLSIVLPELYGPAADAALDARARELAVLVESRDAQRCFHPRLVVLGGLRTVRVWQVTV